ncbi:MAG: DUF4091 domain-containing protein, partial [Armatimonadetes bacterium]|nr:DUF4091 domain-containing protein [Armatimonadota bacterium]
GSRVLWGYQVLGKTSDPLRNHRLSFWDCWRKGITGQGFWCYADAHGSNWDPYDEGKGDYSPVYDGDERELIPSRRWEAWREGVEDYTLLWMLRRAVTDGRGNAEDRAEARELLEAGPERVLSEIRAGGVTELRADILHALVKLEE